MAKTFKEYVDKLNNLLKNNPKLKNLPVYYAVDEEGNEYKQVLYDPSFVALDVSNDFNQLIGVYLDEKTRDIDKDQINGVVLN